MTGELAKNPVAAIKAYVSQESVRKRFEEMLGKRGGAFTNSIINTVRNSASLQKCSPESVMSASIVAATLNLPIDPALGQAAIVPYGQSAQFQIMYRGMVQLCIRSGQYAMIHCSEIYQDELKVHNPITGKVEFNDPSTYKQRYAGKDGKNVVGHYAYFKLVRGFEKADYMTVEEVLAHARKYSKAYQRDLKQNKKDCPWSTHPIPMGNKTVLLRLLKGFGVMSIEMQDAIVSDNSFEATEEATRKQIETEQGSELVDAEFESQPPSPELAKDPLPESKKTKKKAAKKKSAKENELKALYSCNNKKCGIQFDQPKISGSGDTEVPICPMCLTSDIKKNKEKPDFLKD